MSLGRLIVFGVLGLTGFVLVANALNRPDVPAPPGGQPGAAAPAPRPALGGAPDPRPSLGAAPPARSAPSQPAANAPVTATPALPMDELNRLGLPPAPQGGFAVRRSSQGTPSP